MHAKVKTSSFFGTNNQDAQYSNLMIITLSGMASAITRNTEYKKKLEAEDK